VTELVRKGIAPDRLTAEAKGEQRPVADNSTEEGRAKNRRVAMLITQK
jgi:outer membrane protein OmpA-like peptidoglycan-associated protein